MNNDDRPGSARNAALYFFWKDVEGVRINVSQYWCCAAVQDDIGG
jgi:hypothetical protein